MRSPRGTSRRRWPSSREGGLALGAAHAILTERLRPVATGRASAAIGGWGAVLRDYAPDVVAKTTGVPIERLRSLARSFAGESPSVAIIGGPPLAHTNG